MKISDELKWIAPVILVCVAVFANSLWGEFVYDDLQQTLRNPLVQDNALIGKALTADVWAFKGDGNIPASNYWRPTFTAWQILNFRIFGTYPFGWHVLNLLLHIGICVLAYALLRRWNFSQTVAGVIALIFAVHPVHVESVAWVSGSPDLLFALAFFASLWFAQSYAEKRKGTSLALSILFYAMSLGAKEIGILCLPIYYLVLSQQHQDGVEGSKSKASVVPALLGFSAVAVFYFVVRMSIIGAVSRPAPNAPTLTDSILTIPAMFVFYLRQIFFPYWISASYSLETVSQIGLTNFILPLVISIAALIGLYFLARRSKTGAIALLLFLLPLLPAMNGPAFGQGHLIHDRYLYVPLLGMLMLVVPFAAEFLDKRYVLAVGAVLTVVLGFGSFTYSRAWANDFALWEWSVKTSRSAFTLSQYGYQLGERGRTDEAIAAFSDSLELKHAPETQLGRGREYVKKKQYALAEKDLNEIIQNSGAQFDAYPLYQAYESLGITYAEQKKYDESVKTFDEARKKLPIYAATATINIAIVLYLQDQKDKAIRELEGARVQARNEMLPESKGLFLRLGMFYMDQKKYDEAQASIKEFMQLTEGFTDATTMNQRTSAIKTLKTLEQLQKNK